jgi:hypothetical protein
MFIRVLFPVWCAFALPFAASAGDTPRVTLGGEPNQQWGLDRQ